MSIISLSVCLFPDLIQRMLTLTQNLIYFGSSRNPIKLTHILFTILLLLLENLLTCPIHSL